jgi:hypothetical protein
MMNAMTLEALVAENSALKSENNRLRDLLADLTQQFEWLKRQVFGQKSERMVPVNDAQCTLDLEGIPQTQPSTATTTTITGYSRKNPDANKTPHGRDEIPAHIPRVIINVEPDYDATGMEKVGEKITEQLEYKPPEFFVNRYVRPVHATTKNGQRTLVCVDLPPLCVDKG